MLIVAATIALPAIDRRVTQHLAERHMRNLVPAAWGPSSRDGLDTMTGRRLDAPAASAAELGTRAREQGWTSEPCGPQIAACFGRDGYQLTIEEPCRPGTHPCRLRAAITWTDPIVRDALAFPVVTAVLLLAAGTGWLHHRRRFNHPPAGRPSTTAPAGDIWIRRTS